VKWIAAIAMLVACGKAYAAPSPEQLAAYRALVAQDLRLATVGYRLASANSPFCEKRQRNPGWVLHDEKQYPDREIARAAFSLRHPVAVSSVVAGGEAERLGIKAGDGMIAINDAVVSIHTEIQHKQSAERIESIENGLRRALEIYGPVRVTLQTADGRTIVALNPPETCKSRFWVDASSKLDAGADGEGVRITEGLMAFVGADDDELAAVVAHELAHNLLGHRERLAKVKRRSREILATEIEADRLSVWLMTNAGFDPGGALRFAERYGRKTGLGIFSDGTHLRWKNRRRLMQAEIDLMAQLQKQNGLVPPPLLIGG
jgi:beta-barrel assembly-enhancing protease